MPCCSWTELRSRIRSFVRDYDSLQSLALALVYIQIGCALIGSLGALFNGVLVINLVVGLFALVAIESGSQRLGRTYAILLFCAIILDIVWFILFSKTIWNIDYDAKYGPLFVLSLRLALWMQIVGSSVRLLSTSVWIQMYRLGLSSGGSIYNESDYDARASFLSRTTNVARPNSLVDDILGGMVDDPAYYSPLFEDARDNHINFQGERRVSRIDSCSSSGIVASPRRKLFPGVDVESGAKVLLSS